MSDTVIDEEEPGEVTWLSWRSLEGLATQYAPSFYIADVERFERNCRGFLNAFRALYARTALGYSYKTNYLPELILRADSLGAYAEVVSRFEFDLAKDLGIAGERVIFNGPIKTVEDLREAFASHAMINADSLPELSHIVRLARDFRSPRSVGIRCYLGVAETPDSRFGIDLRTPAGKEALDAVDAAPNLRLAGLHCHHSGDRSAQRYADRTAAMIALHSEILGGRRLDYLDIGGGFGSKMKPGLAAQLPVPPASASEYADAVAHQLSAAYGDDGPELILEPGMGVLADTMRFVTRVETVKDLGGRRFAVVDGSIFNIQPLRGGINLPISVVPGEQSPLQGRGPWDVVGHTCMEVDLLHAGYDGPIGIGDFVVVDNVGAYTNVLNAPFIRGTPPILELAPDGAVRVLRRESTARDLVRSYRDGP